MASFVTFLLTLVVVIAATHGKECYYAKFTPDHSACKSANSQCQMSQRGVPPDGQQTIVDLHNQLRQKVANGQESQAGGLPQASNMREMSWDDELAYVAQKHTDQCVFQHDCGDCRQVDRFAVGQNAFLGYDPNDYAGMVQLYYDEVKDFDSSLVDPYAFGMSYGHFSQVVWADSYKVGCGRTVYTEDGDTKVLMACNYGAAGNYEGDAMYKQGSPCSACPDGTSCSSQYPGLCQ